MMMLQIINTIFIKTEKMYYKKTTSKCWWFFVVVSWCRYGVYLVYIWCAFGISLFIELQMNIYFFIYILFVDIVFDVVVELLSNICLVAIDY